jgi:hypothetical protein
MGFSGFIREIYEAIKKHASTGTIGKIFIAGVAPITMDSLTSGFNIALDLTDSVMFHGIAGFTHEDAGYLIEKALPWLSVKKQDLLNQMALLYNGYKFSYNASNRLFNSGMTLYYLDVYVSE